MKSIVRTLWGVGLQAAKYSGLPYTAIEKTTLNYKFGIQSGVAQAAGVYPNVAYYAIGNGGHRVTVGSNEIPTLSPKEHSALDAALFNHLPFVLRPVLNDITAEQRANYALRKEVLIGSSKYYAYYLKRLDLTDTEVKYYKSTVVDGITTTVEYIPDSSVVNPVYSGPAVDNATTTSSTSVFASANLAIVFDEFDVTELLNAAKILYGDESYAIISEIAICSGVDKVVSGTTAGSTAMTYKEAIAVQVATHLSATHNVGETSLGFTKRLELGEAESLLTGTSTLVVPG